MAYREVSVIEVKEILRLWLAGHSLREVTTLAGVDRKTVRRYVQAAQDVGLVGEDGPGRLRGEATDRGRGRCGSSRPTADCGNHAGSRRSGGTDPPGRGVRPLDSGDPAAARTGGSAASAKPGGSPPRFRPRLAHQIGSSA
jgi:hypothetical protein